MAGSDEPEEGGVPAGARRSGYIDFLRRNGAFRRLFMGQVVSYCGDWFLTVALLNLVLKYSGSATLAGLLIVCQSLPSFVLAPWAGPVVDRFDRRKLIIAVSIGQVFLSLLPILARSSVLLPFAYLGALGISSGATFVSPALQSSIPNLVGEDDLIMANVLMGSTWGTMLAVGSALGGIVVAIGGLTISCVFDAATFAFAATLLWTIHRPFQQTAAHAKVEFLASIEEAARYARNHPRVLALLTCKGGFGIGSGAVVLLSVFGLKVFHDGSFGIGMLYASRGVGALAGPFLVRRLASEDNAKYRLVGYCGIAYGLGYLAFAVSPLIGLAGAAICFAHLGAGGQWMISSYGLQREVPDSLRGRMFAADFGLVTLTTSISTILAGAFADAAGPVPTALAGGALMLLWAIVWSGVTRRLWRPLTSLEARAVEQASG